MKNVILIFCFITALYACQSHEYYNKLEEEMASGKRYDSLFLDISFGMTKKDFYAHCWEMNKQGIVTHGQKNMTVRYELKDELKAACNMNFYPEFHEEKIYKMPTTYTYKGWAPWNKHLSADSLLVDVVGLYKKWYGEELIKVGGEHKERVAYILINGNRRISIYKKSVSEVEAMYTDLLVEQELEKDKN